MTEKKESTGNYEWVNKVQEILNSYKGKINTFQTRIDLRDEVSELLRKDGINAFVNTGRSVNDDDMISHGGMGVEVICNTIRFTYNVGPWS